MWDKKSGSEAKLRFPSFSHTFFNRIIIVLYTMWRSLSGRIHRPRALGRLLWGDKVAKWKYYLRISISCTTAPLFRIEHHGSRGSIAIITRPGRSDVGKKPGLMRRRGKKPGLTRRGKESGSDELSMDISIIRRLNPWRAVPQHRRHGKRIRWSDQTKNT